MYSIIREMAQRRNLTLLPFSDIRESCMRKGYSESIIVSCLEEYAQLNVWQVNPSTRDVALVV